MKKSVFALVIIGFLVMLVGGIGAAYYYTPASEAYDARNTKNHQSENTSADTLNLDIDTYYTFNRQISLEPSNDDDFHVKYAARYNQSSFDWKFTEDGSTTNLSFKELYSDGSIGIHLGFIFSMDYGRYETIIQVPKRYKNINITTQDAHLVVTDWDIKNLTIDTKAGTTVSVYDVTSEKFEYTSDNGSLYVSDNKISEMEITTKEDSSLSLNDSEIKKLKINAKSSELNLSDIKIKDKAEITNKHGNTSLFEIKGDVKFTSDSGELYYDSEEVEGNLEATTGSGGIYININDDTPSDIQIDAQSKSGSVDLFGKNTSSYSAGDKKPVFKLKSNKGDISVSSYDSYYDDDEDYDD